MGSSFYGRLMEYGCEGRMVFRMFLSRFVEGGQRRL